MGIFCSKCGSRDTRRSQVRSVLDRIARLLGWNPWRCRGCNRRFYSRLTLVESAGG